MVSQVIVAYRFLDTAEQSFLQSKAATQLILKHAEMLSELSLPDGRDSTQEKQ